MSHRDCQNWLKAQTTPTSFACGQQWHGKETPGQKSSKTSRFGSSGRNRWPSDLVLCLARQKPTHHEDQYLFWWSDFFRSLWSCLKYLLVSFHGQSTSWGQQRVCRTSKGQNLGHSNSPESLLSPLQYHCL